MREFLAVMMVCSGALYLLSYPSPLTADMIVTTSDGRTMTLPLNVSDVRSIEFTDGDAGRPHLESNLAHGKTVEQSSVGYGGAAGRAVDSNTSGDYSHNSVTHTGSQHQAWWQVDLGRSARIRAVRVWNRTDCCSERLSNFYLLISDSPFKSGDLNALLGQGSIGRYYVEGNAGTPSEIPVNRNGRYVRIQLAGTNYLSLAEVEVLGY